MIRQVRKAARFPEAAKRKVAASVVRPFVSGSFPSGSHIDVAWDNLIILDACRHDTFEKYNPFDTPAKPVESNASHTAEFLERNFSRNRHDTVYVTASPQVVGYESRFHEVLHVWDQSWDDELRTVRPESVTEAALAAATEYPDKKLIVHYMQPHYPFIGPTGRELGTHATYTGGLREREHLSVWELLSAGKVSKAAVETAYEENLELVLNSVTGIVEALDGKTVVTSDHGNLFNEHVSRLPVRISGHPYGVHHPELVSVPWVEFPFKTRRTVTRSEESTDSEEFEDVHERLSDLGYR